MEIKDAVRLAILNIQKESITDVDVFARPFEVNYLAQEKNKKIIYDIVVERIKKLNPNAEIFFISAKTGEGVDKWVEWLRTQIDEWNAD